MSPAVTKLLLCLCAGTTGAAVVPVAHRARAMLTARPAAHHIVRSRPKFAAASPRLDAAPQFVCPPIRMALISPVLPVLETAPIAPAFDAAPTFVPSTVNLFANAVPLASSAPEPTSWTLMIIGFGALGGMLRWQRGKGVVDPTGG